MTADRLATDLEVIRRAATDAISFVDGMAEDQFIADRKTQSAVAMMLLVIGEAARQIAAHSPDFAQSNASWPWREMVGLRNRAAHAYDSLDIHLIWIAVSQSLPGLLEQMHRLDT